MRKTVEKALARLLALALLFSLTPVSARAAEAPPELSATAEAQYIQKYGNVTLSLTCDELKAAGYGYGDVLTVRFLDQALELPLCGNFSDVDSGSPALFARAQDQYVLAAINMGDFATTYGVAVKTTHEDKSFEWSYADGVTGPVAFTLSLKEAGGYYDQYVLHQLSFTNEREAYPRLTDEQFANFRPVATTGMGLGVLYRTSSPVNPSIGRSAYADAALRRAGVTVVMNLADDEAAVRAYPGYADSYYAGTKYIALNMGVDFAAEDFRSKLAEGLRFFAQNPGVYAVLCNEGKDRAGFVAALLECLMGASFDEVVADYMETFRNYYGVTEDDPRYETVAGSNVIKTLSAAFGVSDLRGADLKTCAERYVRALGLKENELDALRQNLSARPALDLDALAKTARDTEFFTPIGHTALNYDEIAYEYIDPAPLLKEIAALRELCADAKNEKAFETRLLSVGDQRDRLFAMQIILENLTYADAKDTWASTEYQKVAADLSRVNDAFSGLVRDALRSPCAGAVSSHLSASAQEYYLRYSDMSEEEQALLARETALTTEYQSRIVEPYTVSYQGTDYTQESVSAAYQRGELDYDAYWSVYVEAARKANAAVGPIFVELVGVRNRIAALAGYDSYAAYAYENIYFRDYAPEDAEAYCEAVKKYVLPVARAYGLLRQDVRTEELPKDVAYSGEGMFDTLLPRFAELSDELLESARYTREHRAYDVDPAPNKTGTAFSMQLPYYNIPFFFSNADGSYNDLLASIHELGHNNHAYWLEEMSWTAAPLSYDTAEVHSQALELLMLRYYPALFGAQADAVETVNLNGILASIVQGCMFDEWQRRVYAEPGLTLEKANRIFREVCGEYGSVAPDDERTEMYGWFEVPHNFVMPMYYISYSTSAAGALAFWEESLSDYYAAVDDYLRFSAQPNEMGFAGTFAALGIDDPMSAAYLEGLARTVHDRLLPVAPYNDVYADDWFGAPVIFVSGNDIMRGVSEDAFAPDAPATREQCMTVLARIGGEREAAGEPYTLDEGVAWAVENGVSDGTDRAGALTREQFVTMLRRCAELMGVETETDGDLSAFADADEVSAWAADAMAWAVGAGVLGGAPDETGALLLAPQGGATRAQIAAMLMRLCDSAAA